MRVQLIHPPAHVNPKALTALRPSPPLGLAYIAAALREAGHDVSMLDCLGDAPTQLTPEGPVSRIGLRDDEILSRIDRDAPVLGITNMWSYAWPALRQLVSKIKNCFPEKIIVAGGEHFTGLAEVSMQQAPIDIIVLGEGERIMNELVGKLEAGNFDASSVDGIVWRDGDKIVMNKRPKGSKAVDEIPWPAWDLFDLDVYNEHRFLPGTYMGKTVPVLATRGCPYDCTYCSAPNMWERRWAPRAPVEVADEVEFYAKEYGATHFPFQDLTASLQRKWTVDFAREIIKRNLDIKWQLAVGTRCEIMDDEVCQLLYESGCRTLYFAPESGSDRTRKLIKKKMKREALMSAVESTVKAGITLGIFLVIGFPHDRREDLDETVKLVRELARMGVTDICVPVFYPIPASELYDDLIASGRITQCDATLLAPMTAHLPILTEERNYCEHVSARELNFYKYWIVANFYGTSYATHPELMTRMAKNFFKNEEESKMETFVLELKKKVLGSGTGNARPDTRGPNSPTPKKRVPRAPERKSEKTGQLIRLRHAG